MMEAEIMGGAMEGEDGGSIQLDPFVQPPILKAFFEVLPLEELAKCRLVSKLWYEESKSTWRSNVTIKFGTEGIVSTAEDGSEHKTSLGEFLDLWEAGEWGSCPFKKFHLKWWTFKAEDVEQQRFLELVGGHITSLTFYECTFGGADNFRRIVYQSLPKLQFLEICGCLFGADYGSTEEVPVYEEPTFGVHGLKSLQIFECPSSSFLMELLSRFHKVTNLHMEPADQEEYRNMLEIIRLIRAQDRRKLPLKNFDVPFYFLLGNEVGTATASYIELLNFQDQLNLPLQRLEVCFSRHKEDLETVLRNKNRFRDILQHHSSTLKHLKCWRDTPELYKSFPFAVSLEKLEELELSPRTFDNLNYLRATPNLRVLKLVDFSISVDEGDNYNLMAESDNLFSNSGQLEIGDWTLPYLKELILYELPLSVSNLGKLMKWMPNVERFEGVALDDVKLVMICSNWKNIKILEDKGEELTDEGVIGREIGQGAGADAVPNITKLEKLTSFETHSSRLTSASVHEGFLKLANLKELSLGNFEEMDDEAKAALKRRKIERCQEERDYE